jgi:hypothetical protein
MMGLVYMLRTREAEALAEAEAAAISAAGDIIDYGEITVFDVIERAPS